MYPILDGTVKIGGVHFALHYRQPPSGQARVDYVLPVHADDGADVDADMKSAQKFIGMTRAEVQREFFDSPACPQDPQT